jgi:hypothetical protein
MGTVGYGVAWGKAAACLYDNTGIAVPRICGLSIVGNSSHRDKTES